MQCAIHSRWSLVSDVAEEGDTSTPEVAEMTPPAPKQVRRRMVSAATHTQVCVHQCLLWVFEASSAAAATTQTKALKKRTIESSAQSLLFM